MHDRLICTLARLGPPLVCAALAFELAGAGTRWSWSVTLAALAATGLLLASAFSLSLKPVAGIGAIDLRLMQLHVLAHGVPISFSLGTLSGTGEEALSTAWVIAFGLFFYSGRRTWRALQGARRSPVYFVFLRGNTAMLASSAILVLLAFATTSPAPLAFLEKAYLLYSAIHLILLGPSVAKIHRDLAGNEASLP